MLNNNFQLLIEFRPEVYQALVITLSDVPLPDTKQQITIGPQNYKQKYKHGKDSDWGLNATQTLNRLNEKRYRGPAYFVNALSPYTFIIIC